MIRVKSEGKGSYGKRICDSILTKMFPDVKVKWVSKPPFNLIIQSHFEKEEPINHYNSQIPYILFNGESYPIKSKAYPPILRISTIKKECNNPFSVYIPYLAMTPWNSEILSLSFRYQESLKPKPYFLAYCSSNCLPHREQIFKIIKSINPNESHSFGKCQNNRAQIKGSWTKMINVFKNYRFVLAVENSQEDGYITEKIFLAFLAGAIPIYWGDRNIETIFNVKAFVNMNRFKSMIEVIKYLKYLEGNLSQQRKIRQEPIFNGDPPEYLDLDSPFYHNLANKIKGQIKDNI